MGFLDFLFGKPSPARFARIMTKALRARGVEGPIEYDAARFCLKSANGTHGLHNAYADYCKVPRRDRAKVIEAYAGAADSVKDAISDDFSEARQHVFPKVREPAYYAFMKLRAEVDGVDYPISTHKVISPHHCVELVYDLPQSVMSIRNDQYEKWGVTFEEALKVARDNLWKISNEPFAQPVPGVPGLHVSTWGDSYAATRLYLHDLIWQLPVKGKHIAMTPCRDRLLVAGSDDGEALAAMGIMAKELLETDTRPMHAHAVMLDGTQWRGMRLEPGTPIFHDWRLLELISWARDYAEQKELLDALHQKRGEDVFVATYTVMQNTQTGAYYSHAMWADELDTLLPQTDSLVMVSRDGKQVITTLDWAEAEKIAGGLMTPVEGMYPPRTRVRGFPSLEEVQKRVV